MVINNSLKINTFLIKKYTTSSLNNSIDNNLFWYDENGKNLFNNKQIQIIKNSIIKDFNQDIDHNLYLAMEKKYCIYKYQKGNNIGKYCNRKIYIKNGKYIEYYCSRHNKDYEKNERKYFLRRRCEFIKDNGEQCKNHSKYDNFCFIHKHSNVNIDPFIKLNKLRNIYYKKIKKKKHNNYFKQNNNKKKPKIKQPSQSFFKNNKYYYHNPINLYVEELNSDIL